MDPVRVFLEDLRHAGLAEGNLLGMLHVCIGRRITKADGTLVSAGQTWRDLATLLKKLRWPTDAVRELGLDPDTLPPRDRQRFWYTAITQAGVDTAKAAAAGDRLAKAVRKLGYQVGGAPGSAGS